MHNCTQLSLRNQTWRWLPLHRMQFWTTQPSSTTTLSMSTLFSSLTWFPMVQPVPITLRFTVHFSPTLLPLPSIEPGAIVVFGATATVSWRK